ncbi:MAG TPA: metallo-mystery pair system four-Cys motif protein, partial [Polyangium sp.]|nr:metallo-mystery pair system four-Cys motif protein [Polyangium sp.]
LSLAAQGCSDNGNSGPNDSKTPSPFALSFAATANGQEVGCSDKIPGLGPDAKQTVGLSDMRFYISHVHFLDAKGNHVEFTLDQNEFQYTSAAGSVALIDLTSNTDGTCKDSAVAFAEGTARTNLAMTGKTIVEDVAEIHFDVGVPQALMKETIANNTAEGAPSPLNEMYWNWASGYRHFVTNFTVDDGQGNVGDGYLHIGSRDCGPADGKALEDRAACTFVNTPAVVLADFDLQKDTVGVEIPNLLTSVDFRAPIYDPVTFEVIGEGPGVECHSSPMQPDCSSIFSNFGLDMTTGSVVSGAQKVFAKR